MTNSARAYEEMIYGPSEPESAAQAPDDSHVSEPEFLRTMDPAEKKRYYIALGATVAALVIGTNVYWFAHHRSDGTPATTTKIEPKLRADKQTPLTTQSKP